MQKTISIIVPVYNEAVNVAALYAALKEVTVTIPRYSWEFLFVDDGSTDGSAQVLSDLAIQDSAVKTIEFSRNFGKEAATTAGLNAVTGDAAILMDSDLQHPPRYIPEFVAQWEAGADMVVGVRTKNSGEGVIKRTGSYLFYHLMDAIGEVPTVPGSTDFRLVDRKVINAFNQLTERDRITRGLLDWLGFRRAFVPFEADKRHGGEAKYSVSKLFKLATHSFVSHSLVPLRIAGYLGVATTIISGMLGMGIIIERFILNDPFELSISTGAMLAVFNSFIVGIVLICLGLIALYVANIHSDVKGRPLYIVREEK